MAGALCGTLTFRLAEFMDLMDKLDESITFIEE